MNCKRCGKPLLRPDEVVGVIRDLFREMERTAYRYRLTEMASVTGPAELDACNATANLLGYCGSGCEFLHRGGGELDAEVHHGA